MATENKAEQTRKNLTRSQLEVVAETTVALSKLDRLDEIYDRALDTLVESLPIDRASLLLFDEDGVMRFVAWRNLSGSYRAAVDGHTPWSRESSDAMPILISDAASSSDLESYRETILGEGIRALAFIPLIASSGLIGKFMLYCDSPHEFTRNEIDLSLTIATLVAFTVERSGNESVRTTLLAELRRERNLLDTIVRQMPAGLVVAEVPDGRIVLANERFEEIWRRSVQAGTRVDSIDDYVDWVGRFPDGRPYEPDDWPISRAVRHGELVRDEEIEIVRGDGTIGHILASGAPIQDAEGKVVAGVVTVADVTRLKQIEGSLRFQARASELLTSTLDPDSILRTIASIAVPTMADWCAIDLLEPDGTMRRVAVSHKDVEKIRWARDIQERYPPENDPERNGSLRVALSGRAERYETITDELLQQAAVDEEHLRIIRELGMCSAMIVPLAARGHALGSILFVSTESKRPFTQEDLDQAVQLGQRASLAVDNATLFAREKEARRDAEENARRTARLQEVTAALSGSTTLDGVAGVIAELGIRAFDAQAGVVVMNRGDHAEIVETIGYESGFIQPFRRLPLDRRGDFPIVDAILSGEPVLISSAEELIERYPALQGRTTGRYHAHAAIPLRLDGEGFGAIALSYAEERQFSSEDIEFFRALGRQCAQAIDRARLYEMERQARDAAEEANRSKDEFLATLSHEMRTPLTATLGWARMLHDDEIDDETRRQAVTSIYRSSQSQVRIVEDLLDVSRIVAGKMTIDRKPLLLGEVVRDAIESVRQMAANRNVEIVREMVPVTVAGDEDRLRQVAGNLLSNAVKFSEEGGTVTVRLQRVGSSARLEVIDGGQGIDPQFLPFLFDRFRQADSSTTRSFGGLGLGLSIVKHLVQLHGGSVDATSDGPGHGATFIVELPLADDAEERPKVLAEPHDLSGAEIVVVEDELDSRLLIEAILRRAGARVRSAAGPHEARNLLQERAADAIVSDVAMPMEDGYSFAQALRREGLTIPMIAVTAYGGHETEERAQASGFDAYLRKPLDPYHLLRIVAECLASKRR